MDFNLPEELQILKETVRKFVDRELIPLERECRPEGEDMPEQFIKPLQEKAKAIGLWLLDVPTEYGGAGLDLMSRCVIMEEVARTVAIPFRYAPIFGPEVRPVLFHCNEEQKKRFLLPVIRGEKRICFAQTEPDAGSDPAGMKTRAVKDGDHYVINGTKRFITGAKTADYAQVIAVTDPQKGARGGVSCLIVDMKAPGVTLGKAVAYDDGRHAGADSVRERASAGRQFDRRRGPGVFHRAGLDSRRSHPRSRRAARGDCKPRTGYDDRVFQSSDDVRPAARGPPSDTVHDRRLGDGIARLPFDGLRVRLAA